MKNLYDENYYERGIELKISGYENYRWLPDLTIPMCKSMIKYLQILPEHKILDFGCAKGFIVKAFNELGFNCYGVDVSEYAISKCDIEIKNNVRVFKGAQSLIWENCLRDYDFVISKDVFEHISYDKIPYIVKMLSLITDKMFCVVPLGKDGKYIIPDYELDITHIIREDMNWWNDLFERNGFKVISSVNQVEGIKENWKHYKNGNGFFLLERKIKNV